MPLITLPSIQGIERTLETDYLPLDRWLNEWDERAFLAFSREDGEYWLYMKLGPGLPPAPALSLGRTPSLDEVQKTIYELDSKRHGLREMAERRRRFMREEKRRIAKLQLEQSGAEAEVLAWGAKKLGKADIVQSFRPKGSR